MFTERTPDFYSDKSEGDLLMFSLVLCDLDVEIDLKSQTQKSHFFTLNLNSASVNNFHEGYWSISFSHFNCKPLLLCNHTIANKSNQLRIGCPSLRQIQDGGLCTYSSPIFFVDILGHYSLFSPIKTTLSIIPIISSLNEWR